MKKKLLFLLLLFLALFIFACKEEQKEPNKDDDSFVDPGNQGDPGEPGNQGDPKEDVKYEISFMVEGVCVKKDDVLENTMPVAPTNVEKAEDDNYIYEFDGWNPTIEVATKDQTYVAVFKQIEKELKFSSLEGLKVSILGDSISTFYNGDDEPSSYYHNTNDFYYPLYCKEINSYDKTWWGQLINNNDMVLGINNSWSGTTAGGSFSNAGDKKVRIDTLDDNGPMDILIYYLGTNDLVNGNSNQVYTNAVLNTLKAVSELCKCQIFVVTLGYSNYSGYNYTESGRIAYNEILRALAEEKGWGVIPLDEYIVEDNYSIYLHDRLHYNYKGATLLSKICEKAIKEYNGIEFTEEIVVEHKEPFEEGVVGKLTATSNTGFWTGTNYEDNIYLYDLGKGEGESALYSIRIEMTKADDGKVVVTNIIQSGTSRPTYEGDYVIMVSELYKKIGEVRMDIQNVKVGCIAEFDLSGGYPVEITFKQGDGTTPGTQTPDDTPVVTDGLLLGSYNTGVWSLYATTILVYSKDALDQGSTYINFYVIGINQVEGDTYRIDYLKDVDIETAFGDYMYYILIYRDNSGNTYFNGIKLNDTCTITGDITSGKAVLKFN